MVSSPQSFCFSPANTLIFFSNTSISSLRLRIYKASSSSLSTHVGRYDTNGQARRFAGTGDNALVVFHGNMIHQSVLLGFLVESCPGQIIGRKAAKPPVKNCPSLLVNAVRWRMPKSWRILRFCWGVRALGVCLMAVCV